MRALCAGLLMLLCLSPVCFAGDTDDGIAIDDSISGYHEMDKIQKNIRYVIRNSISRAYTTMQDPVESDSNVSAVNSVVLGSGSKVQGDIIIIDASKGDSTAIAE